MPHARNLRYEIEPTSYNHTPGFCVQAWLPEDPATPSKQIGEVCAFRQFWLKDDRPMPWGVEGSWVDSRYQRQRIATRMYELAAAEACRRGAPLMSDLERSAPADAFWRKQLRKGRAVRYVTGATDDEADVEYFMLRCPPPKSLARSLGMARGGKIVGSFCREVKASRSHFDHRSFRWIQRGRSWILIGCPKGEWQPRKQRCKVGTRAYEVLKPAPTRGRCPRNSIRVKK